MIRHLWFCARPGSPSRCVVCDVEKSAAAITAGCPRAKPDDVCPSCGKPRAEHQVLADHHLCGDR